MRTSSHSHKRNARFGLWAFDLASWLTNYVQYITSFFADVLHNCTRLCQRSSLRSHNEGHLTKRWSASWNRKVVLRVFSRVMILGFKLASKYGIRGICQLCSIILNPGWRGLDCFCTYVAGSPGERPTGFVAPPPICRWSWKRVPLRSAKGLGMLV